MVRPDGPAGPGVGADAELLVLRETLEAAHVRAATAAAEVGRLETTAAALVRERDRLEAAFAAASMAAYGAAQEVEEGRRVLAEVDGLLAERDALAGDRDELQQELASLRAVHAALGAERDRLVVALRAAQVRGAPAAPAARPVEPDDLKEVEGIGPVAERLLRQVGVTTRGQLAGMDPEALDELRAREPALPDTVRMGEWVRAARRLEASRQGRRAAEQG
jgi:predicted flap endonuclease-1-like 5' DNA nuclease